MDNCNCSPFGAPAASAAAAAAAADSGSQRPPDSPQCSADPAAAAAADMSALSAHEQRKKEELTKLYADLRRAERDRENHMKAREKKKKGAPPKNDQARLNKIELRMRNVLRKIAAAERGEDVSQVQVQPEDPPSQSLDENVVRKPGSHVQTLQNLSRDNVCDGHRELMHGHAPPPPPTRAAATGETAAGSNESAGGKQRQKIEAQRNHAGRSKKKSVNHVCTGSTGSVKKCSVRVSAKCA